MAKQNAGRALEAKIASVVALTLILHDSNLEQIQGQLHHITSGQKDYFDNDLAVIDLDIGAEAAEAMDWQSLIGMLRDWSLNPVAVRHAPSSLHERLRTLGLSLDEIAARPDAAAEAAPSRSAPAKPPKGGLEPSEPQAQAKPAQAKPAQSELPLSEPAAAAAAAAGRPAPPVTTAGASAGTPAGASLPCMMVDTPVRGGQRIYARGADLVVTAIVNPGAELIADGSIHVYAPLRGRALAGAAGETGARIFALEMAPELVSIAGIYRTFEDGPPPGLGKSPAEVRLDGDRLELRAIGARGKS